jgi:hypothetical protein
MAFKRKTFFLKSLQTVAIYRLPKINFVVYQRFIILTRVRFNQVLQFNGRNKAGKCTKSRAQRTFFRALLLTAEKGVEKSATLEERYALRSLRLRGKKSFYQYPSRPKAAHQTKCSNGK